MIKKIVILIIIILILLGLFGTRLFVPAGRAQEREVFTIDRGEGVLEISTRLKEEGFLESPLFFTLYLFLSGNHRNLQAGSYSLSPSMSAFEVADKIISGRVLLERITVIEGWNNLQLAHFLDEREIIPLEEFFSIVGISSPQASLLGAEEGFPSKEIPFSFLKNKPEEASLEGYLFPDTYYIGPQETSSDIIKRMVGNLKMRMGEEMLEEIEKQEKSVFEIITMASLIEKEVQTLEDKKMVSDILWRRMEAGIPLQVDATINYITGKSTIRISIEETRIPSPYNTYHVRGLPQGPISNPGIKSIKAALFPLENDYWYYLSRPDTGETIFSQSHREHVEAKNKYLR